MILADDEAVNGVLTMMESFPFLLLATWNQMTYSRTLALTCFAGYVTLLSIGVWRVTEIHNKAKSLL